jgi:hypothetical protein
MELPVPQPPIPSAARRSEAERLIELARALLDMPEEEMAASHVDHAIEALRMIAGDGTDTAAEPGSIVR